MCPSQSSPVLFKWLSRGVLSTTQRCLSPLNEVIANGDTIHVLLVCFLRKLCGPKTPLRGVQPPTNFALGVLRAFFADAVQYSSSCLAFFIWGNTRK